MRTPIARFDPSVPTDLCHVDVGDGVSCFIASPQAHYVDGATYAIIYLPKFIPATGDILTCHHRQDDEAEAGAGAGAGAESEAEAEAALILSFD